MATYNKKLNKWLTQDGCAFVNKTQAELVEGHKHFKYKKKAPNIPDYQLDILKWGVERRLFNFTLSNELTMVEEERKEFLDSKTASERLDALLDEYVILTQTFAKAGVVKYCISNSKEMRALMESYETIPKRVKELGYNFECSITETIKHISSRRQDPTQRQRWDRHEILEGEKWQKDKNQTDIYQPEYDKCLLT